MALNFPNSPALNDVYTDSTSGFSYQWNGSVWISYSSSSVSNIRELDDISSSFNGVTTTFALTVGGSSVSPANNNQLLISLGGVIQNPTDDYYLSGSNIIFTTAPTSGLAFFGTLFGTAVPVGISTVGDVYRQQSYAVTGVQTSFSFAAGYNPGFLEVYRNGAKLISGADYTATTGNTFTLAPPAQNGDDVEAIGYITSSLAVVDGNLTNLLVSGNARVLGVTTLGTNVGAGQTALMVQGNARITGILTVGTGSLTLDGTTNQINGVTISSGIITATSAVIGTGVTINASGVNVTGVVTATSFSGSGSGLTGVGPSQQAVTSVAGVTTVNLSSGSVIYFTHNTNTTVAFANTSTTQEVTFIRTKDNTTTARTISWPSSVKWPNLGDAPTLDSNGGTTNAQTFRLLTRDAGVIWYGWEEQRYYGAGTFLFSWGSNTYGQLGQNNRTQYSSPVQIPGTSWSSIDAGSNHSLATKTDGTLWACGYNLSGQLGQSNAYNYSSPIQIPGTTWSSISAGYLHSLSTKTDGTLWSWGSNTNGELGQSDTTDRSSPVQIPGTLWSSISGDKHSLATKTDGTLWAWGRNYYGQLAQNNRTYYSSPVQIPGTTWSSISGSTQHSLATKTDGTLWSWGDNTSGQLGQSNRVRYSSPVQIPGTSWSSISSGTSFSLATKTDATLWAWGFNPYGNLGQSNTTQYSSPVQIPGTTWSGISAGGQHSLAKKTDGTLWSWGDNGQGKLGQNNRTQYSSPVQIPGTTWSNISSSSNSHLLATFIVT